MRYHKLILPLVILVLGTTAMGTRAQEDTFSIARTFPQFSKSFVEKYKADSHEQVLKFGNGWVKMSSEPVESSVQDNIVATGSPAVPYVGVVQFALVRHFTTPHRTKQDAEKDKVLFDGDSWTYRYTFTYRNGAWVAAANQCEQAENFVIQDRESGQNRKAKFGFHDCARGEG
jgi:hypothetical protein